MKAEMKCPHKIPVSQCKEHFAELQAMNSTPPTNPDIQNDMKYIYRDDNRPTLPPTTPDELGELLDKYFIPIKLPDINRSELTAIINSLYIKRSAVKERVMGAVSKTRELYFSTEIPTFTNLEEYMEHVGKIREVFRTEIEQSLTKALEDI